jgi:hypothetical protein
VVGLSKAIGYDRDLVIDCEDENLRLDIEGRPPLLPADGRSTATVIADLVDRHSGNPAPSPVDVQIRLDDTLRPDVYLEPLSMTIPKGAWRAEARVRSYSIGVDEIRVTSQPYQPTQRVIQVRFVFPVWPLLACVATGLLTSSIVVILKKRRAIHVLIGGVGALVIWFGLRHGVAVVEWVSGVVAPFSLGGSIFLGLVAGILGEGVLPLVRKAKGTAARIKDRLRGRT